MKGEKTPARVEAHVELGIDSYVPRSYIPSERQRMDVYRRIVRCEGRDDIEQLTRDLTDAYGRVPAAVDTLLTLAEIRVLAGSLGVESIIRMEPDLVFAVRDFTTAECIFEDAPGSVRLPDEKTAYWRPPPAYWEMPTLVNLLVRRLRRAAGVL
jgi:transcription-repair coupling factor (superfamily II helicase)